MSSATRKRKRSKRDPNVLPTYLAADEQRRRIVRSMGFAAGYADQPADYEGDELDAWLEGWNAARLEEADRERLKSIQMKRSEDDARAVRRDNANQTTAPASEALAERDAFALTSMPASSSAPRAVRVDGDRAVPSELPSDRAGATVRPLVACGIVAVIDFMNLIVRAWHVPEKSKVHAVRSMFDTIGNLIDRMSPEFIVFAYDGGHDYRSSLYPAYKANREEKPPELMAQIKLAERAIDAIGWPSIRVEGWEADDVMASLAVAVDRIAIGTLLVSSDKDCTQICAKGTTDNARIYRPWDKGEFLTEQACFEKNGVPFSMMNGLLSLCGDSSDNIPGVDGIGKKTAAALMQEHRSLEGVLTAAASGLVKGKNGDRLREQAHIARLSRQLVTLRYDLPVGQHWAAWPAITPRAGWRDTFRDMGLFANAQRLAETLQRAQTESGRKPKPLVEEDRGDASAHVTIRPTVIDERSDAIEGETHADVSDRSNADREPDGAAVGGHEDHGEPSGCNQPHQATDFHCGQIQDRIISGETDVPPESHDQDITPPVSSETPRQVRDMERITDAARRVYETALEYFFDGVDMVSSYFPGSLLRLAWDAGIAGEPFESIDVSPFDENGHPLQQAGA